MYYTNAAAVSSARRNLVEPAGFEPAVCLQSRCSPAELRPHVEMRRSVKQFLKFAAAGALSTSAHYALMAYLISQNLSAVVSTSAGYALGTCIAYNLHRALTFRGEQRQTAAFVRYAAVVAAGAGINAALLYWWHDQSGIPVVPSQIVASVIVLFLNFALTRVLVFRSPRAAT